MRASGLGGRADCFFVFWRFHSSNFPERGVGGRFFGAFLQLAVVLLVWTPKGRECEHAVFFLIKSPPFNIPGAGGRS